MDQEENPATPYTSPFEAIRRVNDDGTEYWSARDLAKILGYALWQKFKNVVEKAQEACQNSGQAVSDHFIRMDKMVKIGSGAQRKTEDYHLSRYACYLIVQGESSYTKRKHPAVATEGAETAQASSATLHV